MRGETLGDEVSENLMTVRDVAKYLRLSEAKVYQMVKAGEIPSIRIGRAWRFKRDLIEAWISRAFEPSPETRATTEDVL